MARACPSSWPRRSWNATTSGGSASSPQRRCRQHDTWSRSADGGFLHCFADATEEEATFRAAAIAREIRTSLIGDGEGFIGDAEGVSPTHVSAVAATVSLPPRAGRTPDMISEEINQRLTALLAEIEARA